MKLFSVAADVAMGLFLGAFLFAALTRLWPSFQHPLAAGLVCAAAVLIVLFRQPNGSLAVRRDRS
jgi:hypothetical protein